MTSNEYLSTTCYLIRIAVWNELDMVFLMSEARVKGPQSRVIRNFFTGNIGSMLYDNKETIRDQVEDEKDTE